jgi:hypothetical protein
LPAQLNFLQDFYDQYGHLNGAETIWDKNYASKFIKNNQIGATNQLFNAADTIIKGK